MRSNEVPCLRTNSGFSDLPKRSEQEPRRVDGHANICASVTVPINVLCPSKFTRKLAIWVYTLATAQASESGKQHID